MHISERALELIPDGATIGLGSGRAAEAFTRALGERVQAGRLRVRAVPTSEATAALAREVGVPLVAPDEAGVLDLTVDGADEVDPALDLIKGYGRCLVREKIVAASSKQLIILVGEEKLVPKLGSRGKLPVEVLPFAKALCERRLRDLGLVPTLYTKDGQPFLTDNGNVILDCQVEPIADARQLDAAIRAIPGVVGTGLFPGMADVVLIGREGTFELIDERRRQRTS